MQLTSFVLAKYEHCILMAFYFANILDKCCTALKAALWKRKDQQQLLQSIEVNEVLNSRNL